MTVKTGPFEKNDEYLYYMKEEKSGFYVNIL